MTRVLARSVSGAGVLLNFSRAQIFERRFTVRSIVRPWRQGQRPALSRRSPQDRVDQSGRAAFARLSSQLDGIVNDGCGRYACQVQKLVEAQAKNLDDLGVEAIERPLRERHDQMIECGPPALHAGDDFGHQRLIAIVG
jgi:hypothetical protein